MGWLVSFASALALLLLALSYVTAEHYDCSWQPLTHGTPQDNGYALWCQAFPVGDKFMCHTDQQVADYSVWAPQVLEIGEQGKSFGIS